MTMNTMNHRPAPEDKCAEFEDMLALLPTGKLSTEESSTMRAHAAICGRCRTKLAEYELLVNALHQFPQASAVSQPLFTIDDIVLSADLSDSDDDASEPSPAISTMMHLSHRLRSRRLPSSFRSSSRCNVDPG